MNKNIQLTTAFAFMACDGEIAPQEITLLSEKFGSEIEGRLQEMVADLNARGKDYILDFLRSVEEAELGKDDALALLRIGADTIYADNKVEYSEIKFYRLVRSKLETVTDAEILASDPRIEDFWLERDLAAGSAEASYFASASTFASIDLPTLDLSKK